MSDEITGFRVRYPEIDRMGIAHHSHYFVWFELGRTEWMRRRGMSYRQLEEREGVFFPLVEARSRFRAPARYDEELQVITRLDSLSRLRVRFDYRIVRPGDGRLLAEGMTAHVAADDRGRPRRLPPHLFDRLQRGDGAPSEDSRRA
ncbi:MAG: thioesterase family protein [Acidobacteriota bacterium]|nr:thioesterase family protein [Acidobacteriota bacterium]MDQ7088075.1 thioesterase family protein [Acidobacteriota bacterium]